MSKADRIWLESIIRVLVRREVEKAKSVTVAFRANQENWGKGTAIVEYKLEYAGSAEKYFLNYF